MCQMKSLKKKDFFNGTCRCFDYVCTSPQKNSNRLQVTVF